ncbi:hypothetical protein BGZ60DRAFT_428939 [Tricladium varicosporioides]|nr:hypothetical protein BGZ60DRAFT_428939 [Hymenoscyphus varicosporioides]
MEKTYNDLQAPLAISFGTDVNLFFEGLLNDSAAKLAKLAAIAEHFTSAAKKNDQYLMKLVVEKASIENEYNKLSVTYKAKISELDDATREVEKYKSQYHTYKTHRDALKIEIPGLEQEVKFANTQLSAMRHQVTSISSELANTKSQLRQTRELLGGQTKSRVGPRGLNCSYDEFDALKERNRELEKDNKALKEEIMKKGWKNARLTTQRSKSIENNDATNSRFHDKINNLGKGLKPKQEECKFGSVKVSNDLPNYKYGVGKHKDLVVELKGDKWRLEADQQDLGGHLQGEGRGNMALIEKAKKYSDCDKKIIEALKFKIKYLEGKLKEAENGREGPREVVAQLGEGAAERNGRKRSPEFLSATPIKFEGNVKCSLDRPAVKKSRSV